MSSARLEAALQALAASRQTLRSQLVPQPFPGDRSSAESEGAGASAGSARWWRRWRRTARLWPVTALASEALQRWWRQQPWHGTGELLASGLAARVRPVVQQHPLATVLAAAVLGAVLVRSKPWRWPVLGTHLRHWPTHASRWTFAQMASAPVQAALAAMILRAAFATNPTAPANPAPSPAEAPGTAPPATQAVNTSSPP